MAAPYRHPGPDDRGGAPRDAMMGGGMLSSPPPGHHLAPPPAPGGGAGEPVFVGYNADGMALFVMPAPGHPQRGYPPQHPYGGPHPQMQHGGDGHSYHLPYQHEAQQYRGGYGGGGGGPVPHGMMPVMVVGPPRPPPPQHHHHHHHMQQQQQHGGERGYPQQYRPMQGGHPYQGSYQYAPPQGPYYPGPVHAPYPAYAKPVEDATGSGVQEEVNQGTGYAPEAVAPVLPSSPVSRLLASRVVIEESEVTHARCCEVGEEGSGDEHQTPQRMVGCRLHLELHCGTSNASSNNGSDVSDDEEAEEAASSSTSVLHYLFAPGHLGLPPAAGVGDASPSSPAYTLLHQFHVRPGMRSVELPCQLQRGLTTELVLGAQRTIEGAAPFYEVVAGVPVVVPPAPPCAPRRLAATVASSTAVDITWEAPPWDGGVPLLRYELDGRLAEDEESEEDEEDDDPWVRVVDLPASGPCSFHDDSLGADTAYTYRVRAVNAAGAVSAWSACASVATPPAPPSSPRAVRLTAGAACSLTVSWQPPEDTNGAPITQYVVEIATSDAGGNLGTGDVSEAGSESVLSGPTSGSAFRQLWAGMATSATALGLIPGKVMAFRVLAVNAHGPSEPSQVVAGMASGFAAPPPPLVLGVDPSSAVDSPALPEAASETRPGEDGAPAPAAAATDDSRRAALAAALPCANHQGVALRWVTPAGGVNPEQLATLPPGVRVEYLLQVLSVQYHEKDGAGEELVREGGEDAGSGDGDDTSSIFSSPDARGPVFLPLREVAGLEQRQGLVEPPSGAAGSFEAARVLPGLLQNGPIVTVTAGPGLPGVAIEEVEEDEAVTSVQYKIGPLVPGGIFMARVATVLKLNPPPGAGPEAAPVLAGSSKFTPWFAFTASPSVPAAPGGLALAALYGGPATPAPLFTEQQRLACPAAAAPFAARLGAELIAAVPPHHGPHISGWAVQICHKSPALVAADLPPLVEACEDGECVKVLPPAEHPALAPAPGADAGAQPLPLVFMCGGAGPAAAGAKETGASKWSSILAQAINDACPVFAQNPQSGPAKTKVAQEGPEQQRADRAGSCGNAASLSGADRLPPALAFHACTAHPTPLTALGALSASNPASSRHGGEDQVAISTPWTTVGLVEWRSSTPHARDSNGHNCTVKLLLPPVLLSGHSYVVRVAAVNACGTGAWSAPLELLTPSGPPPVAPVLAPVGVTSVTALGDDEAAPSAAFVVPTANGSEDAVPEGPLDSPVLALPPSFGSSPSSSTKPQTVFTLTGPLPPPVKAADGTTGQAPVTLPASTVTVTETVVSPAVVATVPAVRPSPALAPKPLPAVAGTASCALWPPLNAGGEPVTWWAVEVADCTTVAEYGKGEVKQPIALAWRRVHAGPLQPLEAAADAPCLVKLAGLLPGRRYALRAAAGNVRGLGPFTQVPLLVDAPETVPEAPSGPAAVLVPTAAAAARIAKTVVAATTAGVQASDPDCEPFAQLLTAALASTYKWSHSSAKAPASAAVKVSWSAVASNGGLPVLEYAVQAAVFSARAATPVALLGERAGWEPSPTSGAAAVQLWYRPQDCDGFCLRLRRFAAPPLGGTRSNALPPFLPVYQGPYPTVHLGALPPASGLALRVRARNARGWGPWSAQPLVVFTPPDVPPAPARPLLVAGSSGLEGSTQAVVDEAGAPAAAAGASGSVRVLFGRPALPAAVVTGESATTSASKGSTGIDWAAAAELLAASASPAGPDAGSPLLLSPLPPPSSAGVGLLSPQSGDGAASTPGGGVSLVAATLQAAVAVGFSSTVATQLLACLATSSTAAGQQAEDGTNSAVLGGILVSGYEIQRAKIPTSILEAAGIPPALCGSTVTEQEGASEPPPSEAAAASKLVSFLASLGADTPSDTTAEPVAEALRRATIATAAAPESAVTPSVLAAAAAAGAGSAARPACLPRDAAPVTGAKLFRLLPGAWYAVRVAATNDTGAGTPSPWAVFRMPPAPMLPQTAPPPPAPAPAEGVSPAPLDASSAGADGDAGLGSKGKPRKRTRAESATSSSAAVAAAVKSPLQPASKVSALLSGAAIDASSVLADVAAMLQSEGKTQREQGDDDEQAEGSDTNPSSATALPGTDSSKATVPGSTAASLSAAVNVSGAVQTKDASAATASAGLSAATSASAAPPAASTGATDNAAPGTGMTTPAVGQTLGSAGPVGLKRRRGSTGPATADQPAAATKSGGSGPAAASPATPSAPLPPTKQAATGASTAAAPAHRVSSTAVATAASTLWSRHRFSLIAVVVGVLAMVSGALFLLLQPPAPSHTPLEPVMNGGASGMGRGAKGVPYTGHGGSGVGGGGLGGSGPGSGAGRGGQRSGGGAPPPQRQKHTSGSGQQAAGGGGSGNGGQSISQQKPKGRGGRASTPLYGGPRR